MLDRIQKPRNRRYAYRLSAAVLAVAAVYGLVSGEEANAFLLVFSALFGVADAHVDPEA